MEKLKKFKPVLAACHQGQKRPGVDLGANYVYNHLVKDICEAQAYKLEESQFET